VENAALRYSVTKIRMGCLLALNLCFALVQAEVTTTAQTLELVTALGRASAIPANYARLNGSQYAAIFEVAADTSRVLNEVLYLNNKKPHFLSSEMAYTAGWLAVDAYSLFNSLYACCFDVVNKDAAVLSDSEVSKRFETAALHLQMSILPALEAGIAVYLALSNDTDAHAHQLRVFAKSLGSLTRLFAVVLRQQKNSREYKVVTAALVLHGLITIVEFLRMYEHKKEQPIAPLIVPGKKDGDDKSKETDKKDKKDKKDEGKASGDKKPGDDQDKPQDGGDKPAPQQPVTPEADKGPHTVINVSGDASATIIVNRDGATEQQLSATKATAAQSDNAVDKTPIDLTKDDVKKAVSASEEKKNKDDAKSVEKPEEKPAEAPKPAEPVAAAVEAPKLIAELAKSAEPVAQAAVAEPVKQAEQAPAVQPDAVKSVEEPMRAAESEKVAPIDPVVSLPIIPVPAPAADKQAQQAEKKEPAVADVPVQQEPAKELPAAVEKEDAPLAVAVLPALSVVPERAIVQEPAIAVALPEKSEPVIPAAEALKAVEELLPAAELEKVAEPVVHAVPAPVQAAPVVEQAPQPQEPVAAAFEEPKQSVVQEIIEPSQPAVADVPVQQEPAKELPAAVEKEDAPLADAVLPALSVVPERAIVQEPAIAVALPEKSESVVPAAEAPKPAEEPKPAAEPGKDEPAIERLLVITRKLEALKERALPHDSAVQAPVAQKEGSRKSVANGSRSSKQNRRTSRDFAYPKKRKRRI